MDKNIYALSSDGSAILDNIDLPNIQIDFVVDPITGETKTTEIYENFQPVTKLNISKENMSDETKGLDIIYHIYF